ncbi:unnamed protein product [Microthlaspi erraticum]|uniref:PGG domain-containing protein n=1 Tax=Microthlaspi erraticum TaxID=1685480 RepID=A0A6D2KLQ9_9BRAS|nr:unnamed protein product [Microthlaspi erraticum]
MPSVASPRFCLLSSNSPFAHSTKYGYTTDESSKNLGRICDESPIQTKDLSWRFTNEADLGNYAWLIRNVSGLAQHRGEIGHCSCVGSCKCRRPNRRALISGVAQHRCEIGHCSRVGFNMSSRSVNQGDHNVFVNIDDQSNASQTNPVLHQRRTLGMLFDEDPINALEAAVPSGPNLIAAISSLTRAVEKLTDVLTSTSAQDPMEALRKERDEVAKIVLVIASLTSVASIFVPPGGLDEFGTIRFKRTLLFFIFCLANELSFLISHANLALLYKPVNEEDEVEKKVATMKKKIRYGWAGLWTAAILFFVAFNCGFWLVCPAGERKVIKFSNLLRWLTLGLTIAKVSGSLCFIFGRRIWNRIRNRIIHGC